MATFATYAEVLTPQHVQMKMYAAGIREDPPGLVLQDILEETGGVYETMEVLSDDFRKQIREVAELTSDERLLSVANLSEIPVSLEHLRHVDPQTLIVIGCRLSYTTEESDRLGLTDKRPPDPRTTIVT